MYDLRCVVPLASRPFLVVVLQSVLCAAWCVLPLASCLTTFTHNGTTPAVELAASSGGGEDDGSVRVGRHARTFELASFEGPGSSDPEEVGFSDIQSFSLYPTPWDFVDGTGSDSLPDRGSELVRLLEGGFDGDAQSQTPHTDQPLSHAYRERDADDEDDDLRLFRARQEDSEKEAYGNQQQEPLVPIFASGQTKAGGSVSGLPNYSEEVREQRTSSQPQDDLIVMAATPTLSRVSGFVRGMLQRFGMSRQTEAGAPAGDDGRTSGGLSFGIQRLIPHRFRPHFVSTSKGLRNIPHQLNDGQLQLAPEEAPSSSSVGGQSSGGPGAAGATKQPGSSGTIGTLFSSFQHKLKAIYPGTVWCGDGNQAKSEDDIGFFFLTDSCCRAHDLCPITIAAGEQFNRLKNNGHFTRSHCDCDKKFYNCLKNANTLVSRQIGYTYFNLLKPQCFRHEHPKVDCTKRSRGKCLTYVVDEKQPKRWQWFDNLIF